MSISIGSFILQTPHVVLFLAVALAANVYLALTNFKTRYILWNSKKNVADIKSRLREELDLQLIRENLRETKIVKMEQQLKDSKRESSRHEEKIEQLRLELSSFVNSANQNAATILGTFKKELHRGIVKIEELETNLNIAEVRNPNPIPLGNTLPYGMKIPQTATLPTTQEQEEDTKKLEKTSRQLVIPGLFEKESREEMNMVNGLATV